MRTSRFAVVASVLVLVAVACSKADEAVPDAGPAATATVDAAPSAAATTSASAATATNEAAHHATAHDAGKAAPGANDDEIDVARGKDCPSGFVQTGMETCNRLCKVDQDCHNGTRCMRYTEEPPNVPYCDPHAKAAPTPAPTAHDAGHH